MGSSYSNVTFRGPDRDRLAAALRARGRTAFVGPTTGGFTVVFDAGIEDNPGLGARELALDVTKELGGLALAATVHDDDVFFYTLVKDGAQLDEYDSNPGFGTGRADPPSGGDTAVLAREFGAPGVVDELEKILRSPAGGDEYTYETTRHSDLADALGLPDHSVGFGFDYVYQGEAEELDGKLLNVGNVDDPDSAEPPAMPAMPTAAAASPFGDFAIPGLGADMQAAIAAIHEAGKHPAHGYFPALIAGDAAAVRALFASGAASLDDPASGKVEGDDALAAHIAKFRGMLGDRHAEYVALALIETPERTVAQGQMVVMGAGDITTIPAACVWERAEGGAFRSLRAYYATGSLTGMRAERAPLLEPAADAPVPDVLQRHFAALAADDLDAVIATFRPDCLSPLPMFPPADAVRRHYGAMLGQNGAVGIQPCLVTADADRCAVEYVTARWDGSEVPPQAGLAVYELRDGLLCQMQVFAELGPQPVGIGTGGLMELAGLGGMGGGGLGGLGAPGGGGMGGGGLGGLEGLGGLGGLGGGGGMGDLSALGGMAELGGPGGMQALQEQMQQMMQQLQGMMGGAGGPGMDAFAGFPAFPGGLPGDELDDGDDDDHHDAPSTGGDAEPGDGPASPPMPPTEG